MLTDVPGSSDYFLGAVVSYANDAKETLLGVSDETLRQHGAVSAEAALEMARGARERFGADVAVAITGIAGPDGGSPEKPVGTVFFALATRGSGESAKKRLFVGDRGVIRRAAAIHALELVRRRLTGPRRSGESIPGGAGRPGLGRTRRATGSAAEGLPAAGGVDTPGAPGT